MRYKQFIRSIKTVEMTKAIYLSAMRGKVKIKDIMYKRKLAESVLLRSSRVALAATIKNI
jgi:hypothetical protein